MPYSNLPESLWSKMDRCVEKVRSTGKPESSAIAICYSSITHKKALVSPYPLENKLVGDLIPPKEVQDVALEWRREKESDGIKGIDILTEGKGLSWQVVEMMAQQPTDAQYGGEHYDEFMACGGVPGIEWARRQLERRKELMTIECSVSGCTLPATQLVAVKSEVLPYCEKHLPGAKEVLERHHLEITSIKQATVEVVEPRTTAIFALKVSSDVSQQIALPDGETPDQHHVTLVFLGETEDLNKDDMLAALKMMASAIHSFEAKLDGVIRFGEGAIALNVNSPYLSEMRQQLVDTLQNLGHKVEDIHGFTPHLTLAYIEPDDPTPEVKMLEYPVEFTELWLFWGDEQFSAPLLGTGIKEDGGNDAIDDTAEGDKATPPPTQPSLDAIAEAIATRTNNKAVDATLVKKSFLEPWLTSVFGTPGSNQLQKVAARTFGFPDPPGTEELKINWKLLYPMGEMYNITQEYLKGRGFSEYQTIPVYRPYLPSEARTKQWQKGDEVRIRLLPLTSWTLDMQEAARVAQFLASPGSPTFVLKTFIPVKSIVSTPNTGIGIPGTAEAVLAGGEYEALVELRYG